MGFHSCEDAGSRQLSASQSRTLKSRAGRSSAGELVRHIFGCEDLIPGGTKEYTAADRPCSEQHILSNDKRFLPGWERGGVRSPNPQLAESIDTAFILPSPRTPSDSDAERTSAQG